MQPRITWAWITGEKQELGNSGHVVVVQSHSHGERTVTCVGQLALHLTRVSDLEGKQI